MKVKDLQVATLTGEAGHLLRESQYVFNYTATERANEVSLTMPIRAQSYASTPLMPVFSMNLPEGYLFDLIARRIAKHERIDDMRLLAITGRRQIGRLQFLQPGEQWHEPPAQVGLTRLLREPASRGLFEFLIDTYFGSGISGVQPKVLMPDADMGFGRAHNRPRCGSHCEGRCWRRMLRASTANTEHGLLPNGMPAALRWPPAGYMPRTQTAKNHRATPRRLTDGRRFDERLAMRA